MCFEHFKASFAWFIFLLLFMCYSFSGWTLSEFVMSCKMKCSTMLLSECEGLEIVRRWTVEHCRNEVLREM